MSVLGEPHNTTQYAGDKCNRGLKIDKFRTKLSTVLCACTEKKTFGLEMLQIETEVATHTCCPHLIEKKTRTLGYRYHYFVNCECF